jgi:hypothetical protein
VKVVYFTHSLSSCWNHGNAHFLRGVLRDLGRRGHTVTALEPEGAWSLTSLVADHGDRGPCRSASLSGPGLERYGPVGAAVEAASDADLVIVHEWNDPALVAAGRSPAARRALHPAVPRHPPPRGQRSGRDPRLRP